MSIATEFDKFRYVSFNEKIIRHKRKRIQSKKHKLGTYEIDKISLSCFDDKRWLIFVKIVSQIVKRLKKILIKKTAIKKIMIIEKDHDN